MRVLTLLFVVDRKNERLVLAMKKRGFGVGKYNGVGGHVEGGESVVEAAVREAREEIGVEIAVNDARHVGKIEFSFENHPDWHFLVHVFLAEHWRGEPKESEEMAPQWFSYTDIPYDMMWVDDRHWLPRVLAGEKIDAAFHFIQDGKAIATQRIDTVLDL